MSPNLLLPQWSNAVEALHSTATAEQLAAQALAEKNEKSGKMSAAQRRKMVYQELIKALENADLDAIEEVLKANPSVALNDRGWEEVAAKAVEHFSRSCVEFLRQRGLHVPAHMLANRLIKRFDGAMFDYGLELAVAHKTTPHQPYQNFVYSLYQHAIQKFLDPKASARAQYRDVRQRLESEFPTETNTAQSTQYRHYGSWHSMLNTLVVKYPSALDAEDHTFIQNLPLEVFDWPFTNIYTAHTLNARELDNFNRFLSDFPRVADEWKKYEKTKSEGKQTWRAYWEELLPAGHMNFATSPLREKLLDVLEQEQQLRLSCGRTHLMIDSADPSLLDRFTFSITKHLDERLGWDLRDRVLFLGRNVNIYGNRYTQGYSSPEFSPGDFLSTLVEMGASALDALVSDEEGLRVLDGLLTDRLTRMQFFAAANLTVLGKFIKARPAWLTWTDDTGNTLGHYLAALRPEKSKNFALQLARWHAPWLWTDNDNGVSVRDIFTDAEADEGAMAVLSKESMKRLMKSEGVAQDKVRARAEQQPRRRM